MKLGEWRGRIMIQKNSFTKDEIGNQKNIWMDYYSSCWAYVNNLSGREYWEAAQANQETSLYFIVRYCSEQNHGQHAISNCISKGDLQYYLCGFHAVSK